LLLIHDSKHDLSEEAREELTTMSRLALEILDQLKETVGDNLEEVNNQAVNNLAIAGITTKQYIDLILTQGLIKSLGNKAILMFGTNDIVYADWTKEQILSDIQQVIEKLKAINNNIQLYFLEITPVALRIDRNNAVIRELNAFLKENLKSARWIALDSRFSDHYGKLNLDYTNDGLHLNEQGYQLLEQIIKSEL